MRKVYDINQTSFNLKKLINVFVWFLFFIIIPITLAINIKNSILYVSVNSNSMAPTIEKGDRLIVSKISNSSTIKRGDIIVFYSKELSKTLIKRVVGLPGDRIYIDDKFNLTINGKKIENNSNIKQINEYSDIKQNDQIVIPNESYFVVGDNLDDSFDSRFWNEKFVLRELIIGKAKVLLTPIDKFKIF